MKTERVLLSLPTDLKYYLDGLRKEGYTMSGYVCGLLEDDRQAWEEHQNRQRRQKVRTKERRLLAGSLRK